MFLRIAASGYVLQPIERVTSMAQPPAPPVYVSFDRTTSSGSSGGSGGSVDNGGGSAGAITDTPPPGYGSDPGTIWFPPPGTFGWY